MYEQLSDNRPTEQQTVFIGTTVNDGFGVKLPERPYFLKLFGGDYVRQQKPSNPRARHPRGRILRFESIASAEEYAHKRFPGSLVKLAF